VFGVSDIGAVRGVDVSSVLLASGGMDDEGRKKGTRGILFFLFLQVAPRT